MPGHTCISCGNTPSKDKVASFHRFLRYPVKGARCLQAFGIDKGQLRPGTVTSVLSPKKAASTSVMLAWTHKGSLRSAPGISAYYPLFFAYITLIVNGEVKLLIKLITHDDKPTFDVYKLQNFMVIFRWLASGNILLCMIDHAILFNLH